MPETLRFLWNSTRGHHLQPWKSPYLRWRLETYTGKKAESIQLSDFTRLLWTEKRQLLRFIRWLREMRAFSRPKQRQ